VTTYRLNDPGESGGLYSRRWEVDFTREHYPIGRARGRHRVFISQRWFHVGINAGSASSGGSERLTRVLESTDRPELDLTPNSKSVNALLMTAQIPHD